MSGYIYAVECAGRIKIGYSKKPDSRFSKIASDAPYPCVLLGYWPGTVADELELQAKFRSTCSHGEWFTATPELLRFISENVVAPPKAGKRFIVQEGDSPLTAWRKQAGLRQHDVAKLLGCGTSFVSQLETGYSGATLENALKIFELSNGTVPFESLIAKKREAAE